MNEAKEIGKARAKQVVRRNSRWVEAAVGGLLVAKIVELSLDYGVVEWLLTLI